MKTKEYALNIHYDRMMRVHDSDNIRMLGYCFEKEALFVQFMNETQYVYFNIKPGKWSYIVASESVGSVLHKSVVKFPSDYPYVRVDD